jgi:hypothetical protein
MLELYEVKVSRAVLWEERDGNTPDVPGILILLTLIEKGVFWNYINPVKY